MMISWEAGIEELVLVEIVEQAPPQWGVVGLVALEMDLPFVGLPWTSESQQKVENLYILY